MYLLVFVTRAVSLISVYAEVLAAQTSRLYAAQTGLAQQMVAWHTAALSMAASIIDTNPTGYAAFASTGCTLSYNYSYGNGYSRCPSPLLAGSPVNVNLGSTLGGVIMKPALSTTQFIVPKGGNITQCVHLPNTSCVTATGGGCGTNPCTTTFKAATYEFNSILFKVNGVDYVVTFAAPATGTTNLQLAGGNQISLSANDMLRQLNNLHISNYTYGPVNGTTINATTSYTILPTAAGVPSGSIALISYPDGF